MKRQESKFDIYNLQFTMTRSVPATTIVTRGYTGHEHMDDFKLINMNGRVYDPVLGRFLSADPVLQFPENSQSYNKYSYVMNNPMRYVDPSGYEMSEWQFQAMMYMHTRSWQRYLNECGITGMDDFAYGMGVEAGMEALIHSVSPSSGGGGGGIDEGNGAPDADELEDRTLGGSGDGEEGEPESATEPKLIIQFGMHFVSGSYYSMIFEVDKTTWEAFCAWGRSIDSDLDGFTNGGKTPILIQFFAGLNPIVSVGSGVKTWATGTDIFGNYYGEGATRIAAGALMISSATTGFAGSWTSTAINAWYTMPLGSQVPVYAIAPLIDFFSIYLIQYYSN